MTEVLPQQYEIWIADLNPATGSEPGKIRPVVIMQSDVLNRARHNTFVTCIISSQIRNGISLMRVAVKPATTNGLLKESYILCDQIRTIDGGRLKGKIGMLDKETVNRLKEGIKAILTL